MQVAVLDNDTRAAVEADVVLRAAEVTAPERERASGDVDVLKDTPAATGYTESAVNE